MADGSTSNYSLILPEVDGAEGTWGTSINTNLSNLDSLLSGGTTLTAIVVDNVKIDGSNIGTVGDNDLITLGTNTVTVAGTLTATALAGPLTGNVTGDLTGNITGSTTVSGTVTSDGLSIGDASNANGAGEAISIGAGGDLKLYHASDVSYIHESGASALNIQAANINISTGTANDDTDPDEYYRITTTAGTGYVRLYHGETSDFNAYKFQTKSTGVEVVGTVTANAITLGDNEPITFNGNLEIKSDGNDSTITESDASGSLTIKGQNLFLKNGSNQNLFAGASSVQIYKDGERRFQTVSAGIAVEGTSSLGGQLSLREADFENAGEHKVTFRPASENWAGNYDITVPVTGNGSMVVADSSGNANVDGTVTADGLAIDGDSVINGEVDIQNGHKLSFFQSDNATDGLQIFVDSNGHSHIAEANTNSGKHLYITGDRILLQESSSSSDKRINIGDNNGVKIYGDDKLRIVTGNGTLHGASLADSIFFYTGDGDAIDHQTMSVSPTGIDVTGEVSIGDASSAAGATNRLSIGAGDELLIYHNANNSYIKESDASGSLTIQGQNIFIKNADGTKNFIHTDSNQDVRLSYDGNSRLQTTSDGIFVYGAVVAGAQGATTGGQIRFREGTDNGTNATILQAPADAGSGLTINLPSSAGTLALTSSPTFTGTTTSDRFTGSQTHNIQSGNETMSGHVGEKTICVGATGTVTYTFPDVADGDKGDTWTVVNASDQSITCDVASASDGSNTQFSKLVASSNPASVSTVTVAKGGVAEFVVTAANVITVFGSGIS